MESQKLSPAQRLPYTGSLEPVIERLCKAYELGNCAGFSFIGIGYEDCNVMITAPKGRYLAKFFSKDRDTEHIKRYITTLKKVTEAGVHHPPLLRTIDGEVVYTDPEIPQLSLVLMQFIEGKTFYELNRAPDSQELDEVIQQTVRINTIDYHPSYEFDSWAVPNIHETFAKVKKYIREDDLKLIQRAVEQYDRIPVNDLPHCFVHGDLTKANVIKGDNGSIYILDFSVSNWYPRIEELSVIASNLLYNKEKYIPLRDNVELTFELYNKYNPLTSEEKQHLYTYTVAGVAMEFLGAHEEKYLRGNDSQETEYWLDIGRTGLQHELFG